MSTLTLSLVQTDTVWHDPQANRANLDEMLRSVPGHSQLVVLPEMFSTGFTMASGEMAEPMDGPTPRWLQQQADKGGRAFAGSLAVWDGAHSFNRFLCTQPDQPPVCYDKRHLFRMADEDEHYTAGRVRVVFPLGGFRICPMICYDLRFPVFFRRTGDYDLIVCVANWPAARRDAWRTLLRARAIENQSYVAGVNRLGRDGNGVDYAGDSLVVGPEGQLLLDAGANPGVHTVTLDCLALDAHRKAFPAWMDADPFDLAVRGAESDEADKPAWSTEDE